MKHENGNQFAEFSDWLAERWNGVENAADRSPEMLLALRRAWEHGCEAGYHEGHVDGYRLAGAVDRR